MAWHLRRLLEAVKEACGQNGQWTWLTGPLALLTWMRTRRERREAAAAMQAVQGLLEAFLGLLEDFRAGRLAAENRAQVDEEPEEVEQSVGRRPTEDVDADRVSAFSAAVPESLISDASAGGRDYRVNPPVKSEHGKGDNKLIHKGNLPPALTGGTVAPAPSGATGSSRAAVGPRRFAAHSAVVSGVFRIRGNRIGSTSQWIPAFAGMTGTLWLAMSLLRSLAERARSPPEVHFVEESK
jgi:hypothetical protein